MESLNISMDLLSFVIGRRGGRKNRRKRRFKTTMSLMNQLNYISNQTLTRLSISKPKTNGSVENDKLWIFLPLWLLNKFSQKVNLTLVKKLL